MFPHSGHRDDDGKFPQPFQVHHTISLDPQQFTALLNAIAISPQLIQQAATIALRAKVISAHLTTVATQVQKLTQPSPGEQ